MNNHLNNNNNLEEGDTNRSHVPAEEYINRTTTRENENVKNKNNSNNMKDINRNGTKIGDTCEEKYEVENLENKDKSIINDKNNINCVITTNNCYSDREEKGNFVSAEGVSNNSIINKKEIRIEHDKNIRSGHFSNSVDEIILNNNKKKNTMNLNILNKEIKKSSLHSISNSSVNPFVFDSLNVFRRENEGKSPHIINYNKREASYGFGCLNEKKMDSINNNLSRAGSYMVRSISSNLRKKSKQKDILKLDYDKKEKEDITKENLLTYENEYINNSSNEINSKSYRSYSCISDRSYYRNKKEFEIGNEEHNRKNKLNAFNHIMDNDRLKNQFIRKHTLEINHIDNNDNNNENNNNNNNNNNENNNNNISNNNNNISNNNNNNISNNNNNSSNNNNNNCSNNNNSSSNNNNSSSNNKNNNLNSNLNSNNNNNIYQDKKKVNLFSHVYEHFNENKKNSTSSLKFFYKTYMPDYEKIIENDKKAETFDVPPYCELAPLIVLTKNCQLSTFENILTKLLNNYSKNTKNKDKNKMDKVSKNKSK
ncbi:hypothetical protein PFMC_05351 [Plasmodium falciparum CAMP/Malaysia]|nr:hypothetical protein PFMC_05351 [Plasmodium falciparum CAMP/Malaysia]